MATVPKNHTRKIAVKRDLTVAIVFTLENQSVGEDVDSAFAWRAGPWRSL